MRDAVVKTAASDSMQVDVSGVEAQLAVVLSYNGAPFAGFARQPGKHTVQGELERALSLALRRPVEVVCAGRTDAGVHARGQVASFPVSREEAQDRNLFKLKRSLQALTDDAIAIQTLALMPPDFSARFSAVEREYRYLVMPGGRHPLFLRDWCWDARRELDVGAMNEAAQLLVGEHDFKSFCLAASAEGKNTVRRLHEVRVVPVNVMGEEALSIRVVGTAFLHSMVRSIVGSLVMVGSGLREPAWIAEVLEARDRRAAGENAPAKGLVFWRVAYHGGLPCYERDALDAAAGAYCMMDTREGGANVPGSAASHESGAPDSAASAPAASPAVALETPAAPGAPVVPEAPTAPEEHGITHQDVKLAEAAIDALEECEESGELPTGSPHASAAFSEAALNAPLPKAVEEAAARVREGSMRRNEVAGPAMPAAPRTRKVKPADPQPAEGEVSLSFEVHRESAAARAAKAHKDAKARHASRKGGLFRGLFGRSGDDDA